jgi:uncharacterized DUF497 family protein
MSAPPPFEVSWDPRKAEASITKHGVTFAQAATVLLDPLHVTVVDAAHSQDEERWFTLGTCSEGKLLAVSHRTTSPKGPPRPRCGSSRRERPRVASASSMRTNPDGYHHEQRTDPTQ